MAATRLDSDERRQRIVDAAIPAIRPQGLRRHDNARTGRGGRHFPKRSCSGISRQRNSSTARSCKQVGCQGRPRSSNSSPRCPPRPRPLVGMVRFMVRRFVAGSDADRADLDPRLRLILHSCLEDGDYAHELFNAVFGPGRAIFNASLDAAVQAGDIVLPPASRASGEGWRSKPVLVRPSCRDDDRDRGRCPAGICVPYAGGAGGACRRGEPVHSARDRHERCSD